MNSKAVGASAPSAAGEPVQKVLFCVQLSAICCCLLLGVVLSSTDVDCNIRIALLCCMVVFNSIAAEVGSAISVMYASMGNSRVGSPCAKGLLI